MKPVYASIQASTGQIMPGICGIKIIPREWLTGVLIVDFSTNTILSEPVLADGRVWIDLFLVEPTFAYSEKPKTSKGGSYYEVSIAGALNNIDAGILQTLETLRYHEFICIVKDKQDRNRIVGDTEAGLSLQITHVENNDNGGSQTISIELFMISEAASPFYIEP